MSELPRDSTLACRHTELGSGLGDWNEFSSMATVEKIPFYDPDKSRTHA
jgi:hypothetical protein